MKDFNWAGQRACRAVVAALALVAASGAALAQQYPSRNIIKIVSPAPPGGSTDLIARQVQPPLQELLKQTVIVEAHGGAGGYIGAQYVAKAPADGYTLLISGAFVGISALLHKTPAYDVRNDLVPVGTFASVPNMVVVGPRLKDDSIAELIADAKARPGKIDMASNGVGTTIHLAGELFQIRSGVKFTHVPYRGWADAVAALTGGETDIMFDNASTAVPSIKAGKTRALAIAGPRRYAPLPDVPTLAEAGVKDAEVVSWFGMMVPRGTPPDVIAALDKAFGEIAKTDAFKEGIEKQGYDVTYLDAKASQAFWNNEIDKWSAVVKAANIPVE